MKIKYESEVDIDYIRKNIKLIRESKNLSQKEVAKSLAIATNSYQKFENGDIVLNMIRLHQIAEVFGMSVVDIINYPNGKGVEDEKTLLERKLIIDYVRKVCKNGADLLNIIQRLIQDESIETYKRLNDTYLQFIRERFERSLQKIHVDSQTKQALEESIKDLNKELLEMSMLLHDADDTLEELAGK